MGSEKKRHLIQQKRLNNTLNNLNNRKTRLRCSLLCPPLLMKATAWRRRVLQRSPLCFRPVGDDEDEDDEDKDDEGGDGGNEGDNADDHDDDDEDDDEDACVLGPDLLKVWRWFELSGTLINTLLLFANSNSLLSLHKNTMCTHACGDV